MELTTVKRSIKFSAIALILAACVGLPFAQAEEATIIDMKPIKFQMKFEQAVVEVKAGKAYEIVFDNIDIQPHNVLICAIGSKEEVGALADKMITQPDALKKEYVPDSDKVLHAMGLVQPGQKKSLKFTAPATAGDYDILCTFPGHWRLMQGTLKVSE
jgi:azurin